jgi:hypothetical protein
MNVKTLLLATALAASMTGVAFAQTGNGAATKPEQTDQKQMNKQGTMEDSKGTAMKSRDTNGGGSTSGMAADSEKKKDASPASPNAGVRTDK